MAEQNNQSPGDGLQSPDLSDSLKPRNRAIKDEKQLAGLIKAMEEENRDRNVKNSRIMSKYNAEKPYTQSALDNDGLGWKSNFSSQPLSTLIDRISPRFARALNSARYLTSAKLPDHVPGAAAKTELFREKFTNLCRNRPEWKNFIGEVSQEDALFGYTAAGFTDEYTWFPSHYRQDEFFVPAGTKQNAGKCQIVILKENFLVHEAFELIEDKEAAVKAGWDIPATVDAINNAMPDDLRSTFSNDARKYEDLYRESNLYASHAKGAKVVIFYNAFVAEVTGKVSHYIIDGRSWKMVFEREDRFNSMLDVCTFFSFQQANGKLQASKGVGRTVYALAGIVDRSRNEVVDRLQLSGKVLVQGDEKHIRGFKMSVIGNAIVISKNFTIVQQKIESGVDSFLTLDAWVLHLMDEISGNVSPASASNQLQGERVTNGQINFIADLQNEAKDAKIERFMTQSAELLSNMQRRAVNPRVEDEDAKEFQREMLASMSREELDAIAHQPAAQMVEDFTDLERQNIINVTTEAIKSPLVNQKEALRRKFTAAVDKEFADAILLPDNDPTETAEQTRTQELENVLLAIGKQVPSSPRDAHLIHLQVLMKFAQELSGTVGSDPSKANEMQLVADHANQHIQLAEQQGTPKEQLAPFVDQVSKIEAGVQTLAQAAQAQLTSQQSPAAPISP